MKNCSRMDSRKPAGTSNSIKMVKETPKSRVASRSRMGLRKPETSSQVTKDTQKSVRPRSKPTTRPPMSLIENRDDLNTIFVKYNESKIVGENIQEVITEIDVTRKVERKLGPLSPESKSVQNEFTQALDEFLEKRVKQNRVQESVSPETEIVGQVESIRDKFNAIATRTHRPRQLSFNEPEPTDDEPEVNFPEYVPIVLEESDQENPPDNNDISTQQHRYPQSGAAALNQYRLDNLYEDANDVPSGAKNNITSQEPTNNLNLVQQFVPDSDHDDEDLNDFSNEILQLSQMIDDDFLVEPNSSPKAKRDSIFGSELASDLASFAMKMMDSKHGLGANDEVKNSILEVLDRNVSAIQQQIEIEVTQRRHQSQHPRQNGFDQNDQQKLQQPIVEFPETYNLENEIAPDYRSFEGDKEPIVEFPESFQLNDEIAPEYVSVEDPESFLEHEDEPGFMSLGEEELDPWIDVRYTALGVPNESKPILVPHFLQDVALRLISLNNESINNCLMTSSDTIRQQGLIRKMKFKSKKPIPEYDIVDPILICRNLIIALGAKNLLGEHSDDDEANEIESDFKPIPKDIAANFLEDEEDIKQMLQFEREFEKLKVSDHRDDSNLYQKYENLADRRAENFDEIPSDPDVDLIHSPSRPPPKTDFQVQPNVLDESLEDGLHYQEMAQADDMFDVDNIAEPARVPYVPEQRPLKYYQDMAMGEVRKNMIAELRSSGVDEPLLQEPKWIPEPEQVDPDVQSFADALSRLLLEQKDKYTDENNENNENRKQAEEDELKRYKQAQWDAIRTAALEAHERKLQQPPRPVEEDLREHIAFERMATDALVLDNSEEEIEYETENENNTVISKEKENHLSTILETSAEYKEKTDESKTIEEKSKNIEILASRIMDSSVLQDLDLLQADVIELSQLMDDDVFSPPIHNEVDQTSQKIIPHENSQLLKMHPATHSIGSEHLQAMENVEPQIQETNKSVTSKVQEKFSEQLNRQPQPEPIMTSKIKPKPIVRKNQLSKPTSRTKVKSDNKNVYTVAANKMFSDDHRQLTSQLESLMRQFKPGQKPQRKVDDIKQQLGVLEKIMLDTNLPFLTPQIEAMTVSRQRFIYQYTGLLVKLRDAINNCLGLKDRSNLYDEIDGYLKKIEKQEKLMPAERTFLKQIKKYFGLDEHSLKLKDPRAATIVMKFRQEMAQPDIKESIAIPSIHQQSIGAGNLEMLASHIMKSFDLHDVQSEMMELSQLMDDDVLAEPIKIEEQPSQSVVAKANCHHKEQKLETPHQTILQDSRHLKTEPIQVPAYVAPLIQVLDSMDLKIKVIPYKKSPTNSPNVVNRPVLKPNVTVQSKSETKSVSPETEDIESSSPVQKLHGKSEEPPKSDVEAHVVKVSSQFRQKHAIHVESEPDSNFHTAEFGRNLKTGHPIDIKEIHGYGGDKDIREVYGLTAIHVPGSDAILYAAPDKAEEMQKILETSDEHQRIRHIGASQFLAFVFDTYIQDILDGKGQAPIDTLMPDVIEERIKELDELGLLANCVKEASNIYKAGQRKKPVITEPQQIPSTFSREAKFGRDVVDAFPIDIGQIYGFGGHRDIREVYGFTPFKVSGSDAIYYALPSAVVETRKTLEHSDQLLRDLTIVKNLFYAESFDIYIQQILYGMEATPYIPYTEDIENRYFELKEQGLLDDYIKQANYKYKAGEVKRRFSDTPEKRPKATDRRHSDPPRLYMETSQPKILQTQYVEGIEISETEEKYQDERSAIQPTQIDEAIELKDIDATLSNVLNLQNTSTKNIRPSLKPKTMVAKKSQSQTSQKTKSGRATQEHAEPQTKSTSSLVKKPLKTKTIQPQPTQSVYSVAANQMFSSDHRALSLDLTSGMQNAKQIEDIKQQMSVLEKIMLDTNIPFLTPQVEALSISRQKCIYQYTALVVNLRDAIQRCLLLADKSILFGEIDDYIHRMKKQEKLMPADRTFLQQIRKFFGLDEILLKMPNLDAAKIILKFRKEFIKEPKSSQTVLAIPSKTKITVQKVVRPKTQPKFSKSNQQQSTRNAGALIQPQSELSIKKKGSTTSRTASQGQLKITQSRPKPTISTKPQQLIRKPLLIQPQSELPMKKKSSTTSRTASQSQLKLSKSTNVYTVAANSAFSFEHRILTKNLEILLRPSISGKRNSQKLEEIKSRLAALEKNIFDANMPFLTRRIDAMPISSQKFIFQYTSVLVNLRDAINRSLCSENKSYLYDEINGYLKKIEDQEKLMPAVQQIFPHIRQYFGLDSILLKIKHPTAEKIIGKFRKEVPDAKNQTTIEHKQIMQNKEVDNPRDIKDLYCMLYEGAPPRLSVQEHKDICKQINAYPNDEQLMKRLSILERVMLRIYFPKFRHTVSNLMVKDRRVVREYAACLLRIGDTLNRVGKLKDPKDIIYANICRELAANIEIMLSIEQGADAIADLLEEIRAESGLRNLFIKSTEAAEIIEQYTRKPQMNKKIVEPKIKAKQQETDLKPQPDINQTPKRLSPVLFLNISPKTPPPTYWQAEPDSPLFINTPPSSPQQLPPRPPASPEDSDSSFRAFQERFALPPPQEPPEKSIPLSTLAKRMANESDIYENIDDNALVASSSDDANELDEPLTIEMFSQFLYKLKVELYFKELAARVDPFDEQARADIVTLEKTIKQIENKYSTIENQHIEQHVENVEFENIPEDGVVAQSKQMTAHLRDLKSRVEHKKSQPVLNQQTAEAALSSKAFVRKLHEEFQQVELQIEKYDNRYRNENLMDEIVTGIRPPYSEGFKGYNMEGLAKYLELVDVDESLISTDDEIPNADRLMTFSPPRKPKDPKSMSLPDLEGNDDDNLDEMEAPFPVEGHFDLPEQSPQGYKRNQMNDEYYHHLLTGQARRRIQHNSEDDEVLRDAEMNTDGLFMAQERDNEVDFIPEEVLEQPQVIEKQIAKKTPFDMKGRTTELYNQFIYEPLTLELSEDEISIPVPQQPRHPIQGEKHVIDNAFPTNPRDIYDVYFFEDSSHKLVEEHNTLSGMILDPTANANDVNRLKDRLGILEQVMFEQNFQDFYETVTNFKTESKALVYKYAAHLVKLKDAEIRLHFPEIEKCILALQSMERKNINLLELLVSIRNSSNPTDLREKSTSQEQLFIGLDLDNNPVDIRTINGFGGTLDIREAYGFEKLYLSDTDKDLFTYIPPSHATFNRTEMPHTNLLLMLGADIAHQLDLRLGDWISRRNIEELNVKLRLPSLAQLEQMMPIDGNVMAYLSGQPINEVYKSGSVSTHRNTENAINTIATLQQSIDQTARLRALQRKLPRKPGQLHEIDQPFRPSQKLAHVLADDFNIPQPIVKPPRVLSPRHKVAKPKSKTRMPRLREEELPEPQPMSEVEKRQLQEMINEAEDLSDYEIERMDTTDLFNITPDPGPLSQSKYENLMNKLKGYEDKDLTIMDFDEMDEANLFEMPQRPMPQGQPDDRNIEDVEITLIQTDSDERILNAEVPIDAILPTETVIEGYPVHQHTYTNWLQKETILNLPDQQLLPLDPNEEIMTVRELYDYYEALNAGEPSTEAVKMHTSMCIQIEQSHNNPQRIDALSQRLRILEQVMVDIYLPNSLSQLSEFSEDLQQTGRAYAVQLIKFVDAFDRAKSRANGSNLEILRAEIGRYVHTMHFMRQSMRELIQFERNLRISFGLTYLLEETTSPEEILNQFIKQNGKFQLKVTDDKSGDMDPRYIGVNFKNQPVDIRQIYGYGGKLDIREAYGFVKLSMPPAGCGLYTYVPPGYEPSIRRRSKLTHTDLMLGCAIAHQLDLRIYDWLKGEQLGDIKYIVHQLPSIKQLTSMLPANGNVTQYISGQPIHEIYKAGTVRPEPTNVPPVVTQPFEVVTPKRPGVGDTVQSSIQQTKNLFDLKNRVRTKQGLPPLTPPNTRQSQAVAYLLADQFEIPESEEEAPRQDSPRQRVPVVRRQNRLPRLQEEGLPSPPQLSESAERRIAEDIEAAENYENLSVLDIEQLDRTDFLDTTPETAPLSDSANARLVEKLDALTAVFEQTAPLSESAKQRYAEIIEAADDFDGDIGVLNENEMDADELYEEQYPEQNLDDFQLSLLPSPTESEESIEFLNAEARAEQLDGIEQVQRNLPPQPPRRMFDINSRIQQLADAAFTDSDSEPIEFIPVPTIVAAPVPQSEYAMFMALYENEPIEMALKAHNELWDEIAYKLKTLNPESKQDSHVITGLKQRIRIMEQIILELFLPRFMPKITMLNDKDKHQVTEYAVHLMKLGNAIKQGVEHRYSPTQIPIISEIEKHIHVLKYMEQFLPAIEPYCNELKSVNNIKDVFERTTNPKEMVDNFTKTPNGRLELLQNAIVTVDKDSPYIGVDFDNQPVNIRSLYGFGGNLDIREAYGFVKLTLPPPGSRLYTYAPPGHVPIISRNSQFINRFLMMGAVVAHQLDLRLYDWIQGKQLDEPKFIVHLPNFKQLSKMLEAKGDVTHYISGQPIDQIYKAGAAHPEQISAATVQKSLDQSKQIYNLKKKFYQMKGLPEATEKPAILSQNVAHLLAGDFNVPQPIQKAPRVLSPRHKVPASRNVHIMARLNEERAPEPPPPSAAERLQYAALIDAAEDYEDISILNETDMENINLLSRTPEPEVLDEAAYNRLMAKLDAHEDHNVFDKLSEEDASDMGILYEEQMDTEDMFNESQNKKTDGPVSSWNTERITKEPVKINSPQVYSPKPTTSNVRTPKKQIYRKDRVIPSPYDSTLANENDISIQMFLSLQSNLHSLEMSAEGMDLNTTRNYKLKNDISDNKIQISILTDIIVNANFPNTVQFIDGLEDRFCSLAKHFALTLVRLKVTIFQVKPTMQSHLKIELFNEIDSLIKDLHSMETQAPRLASIFEDIQTEIGLNDILRQQCVPSEVVQRYGPKIPLHPARELTQQQPTGALDHQPMVEGAIDGKRLLRLFTEVENMLDDEPFPDISVEEQDLLETVEATIKTKLLETKNVQQIIYVQQLSQNVNIVPENLHTAHIELPINNMTNRMKELRKKLAIRRRELGIETIEEPSEDTVSEQETEPTILNTKPDKNIGLPTKTNKNSKMKTFGRPRDIFGKLIVPNEKSEQDDKTHEETNKLQDAELKETESVVRVTKKPSKNSLRKRDLMGKIIQPKALISEEERARLHATTDKEAYEKRQLLKKKEQQKRDLVERGRARIAEKAAAKELAVTKSANDEKAKNSQSKDQFPKRTQKKSKKSNPSKKKSIPDIQIEITAKPGVSFTEIQNAQVVDRIQELKQQAKRIIIQQAAQKTKIVSEILEPNDYQQFGKGVGASSEKDDLQFNEVYSAGNIYFEVQELQVANSEDQESEGLEQQIKVKLIQSTHSLKRKTSKSSLRKRDLMGKIIRPKAVISAEEQAMTDKEAYEKSQLLRKKEKQKQDLVERGRARIAEKLAEREQTAPMHAFQQRRVKPEKKVPVNLKTDNKLATSNDTTVNNVESDVGTVFEPPLKPSQFELAKQRLDLLKATIKPIVFEDDRKKVKKTRSKPKVKPSIKKPTSEPDLVNPPKPINKSSSKIQAKPSTSSLSRRQSLGADKKREIEDFIKIRKQERLAKAAERASTLRSKSAPIKSSSKGKIEVQAKRKAKQLEPPVVASSEQKMMEKRMLNEQEIEKSAPVKEQSVNVVEEFQQLQQEIPKVKPTKLERLQSVNEDLKLQIKELDQEYQQFIDQPIEIEPFNLNSKEYNEKFSRIMALMGRPQSEPVPNNELQVPKIEHKVESDLVKQYKEILRAVKNDKPKKKPLIYYANRNKSASQTLPRKPQTKQSTSSIHSLVKKRPGTKELPASATSSTKSLSNKTSGSKKPSTKIPASEPELVNPPKPKSSRKIQAKPTTSSLSRRQSMGDDKERELEDVIQVRKQERLAKAAERASGLLSKSAPTKSESSTRSLANKPTETKKIPKPAKVKDTNTKVSLKLSKPSITSIQILSTEQAALIRRFQNIRKEDVKDCEMPLFNVYKQLCTTHGIQHSLNAETPSESTQIGHTRQIDNNALNIEQGQSTKRRRTRTEKLEIINQKLQEKIARIDEEYKRFVAQPIEADDSHDDSHVTSTQYKEQYNAILTAVGKHSVFTVQMPEIEHKVESDLVKQYKDTLEAVKNDKPKKKPLIYYANKKKSAGQPLPRKPQTKQIISSIRSLTKTAYGTKELTASGTSSTRSLVKKPLGTKKIAASATSVTSSSRRLGKKPSGTNKQPAPATSNTQNVVKNLSGTTSTKTDPHSAKAKEQSSKTTVSKAVSGVSLRTRPSKNNTSAFKKAGNQQFEVPPEIISSEQKQIDRAKAQTSKTLSVSKISSRGSMKSRPSKIEPSEPAVLEAISSTANQQKKKKLIMYADKRKKAALGIGQRIQQPTKPNSKTQIPPPQMPNAPIAQQTIEPSLTAEELKSQTDFNFLVQNYPKLKKRLTSAADTKTRIEDIKRRAAIKLRSLDQA